MDASEGVGGSEGGASPLEGGSGQGGVLPPLSFDPRQDAVTPDQAVEWMRRYAVGRPDSVDSEGAVSRYCREVLGVEPDDWQDELFRAYGRGEPRMSERSGHGVGKTAALSILIGHHTVTEFPQKTAVTAPTEKQMFNGIYPEVVKWFGKLPVWVRSGYEIKADRIEHINTPEMPNAAEECFTSFATARAEKPEALAGVHCEDGSVMLVGDEASGISEKVFESASGSMSGARVRFLLAGNPIHTAGLFYESHTKLKKADNDGPPVPGKWWTVHVNCETCKRVTQDFIADKAARYGEDSNEYRIRVLGEFPRADQFAIIPIEHIHSAQARETVHSPAAPMVWGLDVARQGGDRSALTKRKGHRVVEKPLMWRIPDTMMLAAVVHEEWTATRPSDRPVEILVDSIGYGAGVVDRLNALGLPVRGVNVAEMPSLKDQYVNLRAELAFAAKAWFAKLDCSIPPDDLQPGGVALGAELANLRYKYSPKGKFLAESKDEIRKRGFPSPDIADSFLLTFASTAATMLHGHNAQYDAPVKRDNKWFQLT